MNFRSKIIVKFILGLIDDVAICTNILSRDHNFWINFHYYSSHMSPFPTDDVTKYNLLFRLCANLDHRLRHRMARNRFISWTIVQCCHWVLHCIFWTIFQRGSVTYWHTVNKVISKINRNWPIFWSEIEMFCLHK